MSEMPAALAGRDLDRFFGEELADSDPEIFGAIGDELTRQQDQIELIARPCFRPPAP